MMIFSTLQLLFESAIDSRKRISLLYRREALYMHVMEGLGLISALGRKQGRQGRQRSAGNGLISRVKLRSNNTAPCNNMWI
jgi:hypothetical protein